jgi:hypothetical protein
MPAIPAVLRRGPRLVGRVPLTLALTVVALIGLGVGGYLLAFAGSDETHLTDPAPENHNFHIDGEANRYAGPSPLKVSFFADSFHSKGKVDYYWRFDDGFFSRSQNPTHTFVKPGYYQVLVDAIDRKTKFNDRFNLFMGVWPADIWARAQSGKGIANKQEIAAQWRRTNARKRKLIQDCLNNAECRKRQIAIDQAKVTEYQKEWNNCSNKAKCKKYLLPALRKARQVVAKDKQGIPTVPK